MYKTSGKKQGVSSSHIFKPCENQQHLWNLSLEFLIISTILSSYYWYTYVVWTVSLLNCTTPH